MNKPEIGPEEQTALENILGYLNFSSGNPDVQFLSNLNRVFGICAASSPDLPTYQVVGRLLQDTLAELHDSSPTFSDSEQANAVLSLVCEHVVPGYTKFHQDLLFHQSDDVLLHPFFLGRIFEVILAHGPPWDDVGKITQASIHQLSDYIGYRPVATLESQKIEPYAHEWVRPVPLFIKDAGVTVGRYHDVVRETLTILAETDDDLLHLACFDLDRLDELAFDPRACDFDHPASKRPNYHFGQWDPHQIDNKGFYRRFVIQQVTLDALIERAETASDLSADEMLIEAAAVLAGTILMASGISGEGPDTHDTQVTLAGLLQKIAGYRDEFYQRLFTRLSGAHAERLRAEAQQRRQPFGAARQHLNTLLARRRATQMERVQLATIFARMGYTDAAARQVSCVPVTSARLLCEIDCLITIANQAIDDEKLEEAIDLLGKQMALVHRGIECGAIIDPWNILGFDAHFSLFPSPENSVRDIRADELIVLMEQIFALYSRAWSEASARDQQALSERISVEFRKTAEWWHQFAVHEVSTVEGFHAMDAFTAAERVAKALNLWHKGGAAAGDIGFWAPHAEMFDSPNAYAMLVDTLLDRGDFVASIALMVHWLSQSERIELEKGDSSFHHLAQRWLHEVRTASDRLDAEEQWKLVQKMFDYLEANAEQAWDVPEFELGTAARPPSENDELDALFDSDEDEDDEEEEDNLYGAAYEDVVFRDSTDDGMDGEIFDPDAATEDELEQHSRRITARLAFHECLAQLWKTVAVEFSVDAATLDQRRDSLRNWYRQAETNRRELIDLMADVHEYRIPAPLGDHDSMVRYDRHRVIKENLLDRIIATCVETSDAARYMSAALRACDATAAVDNDQEETSGSIRVMAAAFRGDPDQIHQHWDELIESLSRQPLLYVPLSRNGDPRKIVRTRMRQRMIQDLLSWLPRLGLVTKTCHLIETARKMERKQPVGGSAVTEFDELFETGFRSLVERLTQSAANWPDDDGLVPCLEQLTQTMLMSWLAHSRTLRLSVLEKISGDEEWENLVAFIKRYGGDLFTQRFLNIGNLRAIMHQGVDQWLTQLSDEQDYDEEYRIVEELDKQLPREDAVEHLSTILEAVIENYTEYRDYNSTTTQSDRGEMLYMLLDFLRLRNDYDRIAWNLRPVIQAHEILVRGGFNEAAEQWRRGLKDRISDQVRQLLDRLAELQQAHAMQMPTVADRLNECFIRPMSLDRIRALVGPALRELGQPGPHTAFDLLETEATSLAEEPSGVGLDIPGWLIALEDEVEKHRGLSRGRVDTSEPFSAIPKVHLAWEEFQAQLDEWDDLR